MIDTKRILNLGAGKEHLVAGALTVDVRREAKPDVIHDLNLRPWPFEDGSFDEVHCHDVIEHLTDIVATLAEIHRVADANACVYITTPHFSSRNAFTDPTHRHYLGLHSFDYFLSEPSTGYLDYYSAHKFQKLRAEVVFEPTLSNMLVRRIARRWPDYWEARLAWIWPGWFMRFELLVIKAGTSSPGPR